MNRVKRFPFYLLVAAAAFTVGYVGSRLLIIQASPIKAIPPELPITFQPNEQNKGRQCRAVYYGLGNGDGVYDPYCFDLQEKLSAAAGAGEVSRIKDLLRNGANADSYSGNHFPPLFLAAQGGHYQAVRMLLDNGANPNRRYPLNATPLSTAVHNNRPDVVSLLLSRGADYRLSDDDDTLLKVAQGSHYKEIVDLLEAVGAPE